MIKGILSKFQPLKGGNNEVSVLITTTKEHLHELVDLQDKEITIQALQEELPIQLDAKKILDDISTQMRGIKQILTQIYPQDYEP
jgi:hypothetical protein